MSKNVIVGFQLRAYKIFEPIVKIVINKLQGITFGVSTCNIFLQRLNIVDDYFEKNKQPLPVYLDLLQNVKIVKIFVNRKNKN